MATASSATAAHGAAHGGCGGNSDDVGGIACATERTAAKLPTDADAALQQYDTCVTFDDRVAFLTKQLSTLDCVQEWKLAVKRELAKPEYSVKQLESMHLCSSSDKNPMFHGVLEKMGLVRSLQRAVIDLHCTAAQAAAAAAEKLSAQSDDTALIPAMQNTRGCSLDAVLHARERWEAITRDEMLCLANETRQPLVTHALDTATVQTSAAAQATTALDDVLSGESATSEQKLMKPRKLDVTRFLYDSTDLLHALQGIAPTNRSAAATASAQDTWGSIQLLLYTPPLAAFRQQFAELAPTLGQIGLDELFSSERQAFVVEKNRIGDLVVAHQSVAMARQFAKTGCPSNLRPHIWRQALGVVVNADATQRFADLEQRVVQTTFLTDDMYALDLQQAVDSTDYFVFQDHLESVVMAFTRDDFVFDHALQVNGHVYATDATDSSNNASATTGNSVVPPNGVLPFSGLVLYAAPLTYLSNDTVEIYFVFRAMYVRYWSKLNAIRTESGTILPLCKLFEALVLETSAAAVFHLVNVNIQPLDIAFPWIQSAFSGVLEIRQLLLLWDRVVGFDKLEIVAVFAAALFHFRADELCAVSTIDDVDDVFAELLEIQVVPLLQAFLFLLPSNAPPT